MIEMSKRGDTVSYWKSTEVYLHLGCIMHHYKNHHDSQPLRYIHHYCRGILESKITCNANGVANRDKPTVNYQLPNLKSEGSINSVKQFINLNVI